MGEMVEPVRAPVGQPVPEPIRGPLAPHGGAPIDVTPPPRSRFRRIVGGPIELIRFVIRRVLWIIIRVLRGLWRHPLVTLLAVLIIYLGYRGYQEYLVEQPPPPPPAEYVAVELIPPPERVVSYLQAQRRFDAQAMWANYSPQAQRQNEAASIASLPALQSFLSNFQLNAVEFQESKYIGGYDQGSDYGIFFYLTPLKGPGGTITLYQVFVVDDNGMLVRVDLQRVEP